MSVRTRARYLFVFLVFPVVLAPSSGGFLQVELERSTAFADEGTVIAVYDGDTIKVRLTSGEERKIRLIGIDAPELASEKESVKFQALMAKRFVFFHLYGQKIRLSFEPEREDKFGRILAYIWTEKEGLFNRFALSEGFARVYLKFPFEHRGDFIQAEQEARGLKKGLWRKGDYPLLRVDETAAFIGQIFAVEFTCRAVQSKGKFVYLHSEGDFSVLIPREDLHIFPDVRSFLNKALSVTGFLEKYRGKPQMVAFLTSQIKVMKN